MSSSVYHVSDAFLLTEYSDPYLAYTRPSGDLQYAMYQGYPVVIWPNCVINAFALFAPAFVSSASF